MSQTIAGRTVGTGIMAAITMTGVILSGYLPLAGVVIMLFAGLPAILAGLAWGGAWFAAYGAASLGLAFWWGGLPSSLMLVLLMLAPAAVLAWTINRGFDPMQAIGIALTAACVLSLTFWLISPLIGDFGGTLWGIGDDFRQQGRLAETQIRALNSSKELETAKLDLFIELFRSLVDFVALLVPMTFIFVWHLVSLGALHVGASLLAPHFGFTIKALPRFSTWRFNWNIIWVLFAGWFLFYGAEQFGPLGLEPAARMVGANCLAISKILFFIAGCSILVHFFEFYQFNPPLRLGFSILGILFHQIVVWLGVADIWFDFRAPKPAKRASNDSDEDSFF